MKETTSTNDNIVLDGDITVKVEADQTAETVPSADFVNNLDTTEATVKKVWDDANDQDGKRPKTLTVTLSNGTSVTLNEENNWTAKVENLPKYANGQEIDYTWTEDQTGLPEGYSLSGTSKEGTITTITNTYAPGKTSATVKKEWDDANNQDGIRPTSLTVKLQADGVDTGKTVTLNAANSWTDTLSNLDEMKDGKAIVYTWAEDEKGLPEGYKLTNTSKQGTVTTLTNTYTPEETEATVLKVWVDGGNQDNIRPETITVQLMANGTPYGGATVLSASNGWTDTITNLPKNAGGEAIKYTWTEGTLSTGYELTSIETSGTVTTITNTHTPEVTTASVKKVWEDNNDQDGIRPKKVTVQLTADGKNYGDPVELTEAGEWTNTWTKLPKFNKGKEVVYDIKEVEVDGYTVSTEKKEGEFTFTLTNTHTPETTKVNVLKVWEDAQDQDGKRPDKISVQLKKNGQPEGEAVTLNAENGWTYSWTDLPAKEKGAVIRYSVDEAAISGYQGVTTTETKDGTFAVTITNTHTTETTEAEVVKVWDDKDDQDGKRPDELTVTLLANNKATEHSVTLNEANNWTAKVENLPMFEGGHEITYTWSEELPSGYTLTGNATEGKVTTLTNSYTPGKTSASVVKVWDDAENQDGIRPDELVVMLLADGAETGQTVTLNEANNWQATITGLDQKKNKKDINYTWKEVSVPEGYSLSGNTKEGTVSTLTNTHKPAVTEATVKKVWDDAEDQDGKRPESLTVTLSNGTTVTLNEENNWEAKVENLPKYAAGEEIVYTWTEGTLPEGYELTSTATEGTITTLTNTHAPEVTEATVKKVWDDAENQDGKRPESLTVTLSNGTTVTLNEENNWEAKVENLPKYAAGEEIVYTWTEGTLPEGYELTGTSTEGTITTLTNTHTPEVTEATVKKVWDDAEDQDGIRPASLKVTLSNGTAVTLDESNKWTATIKDLPKYAKGTEIEYTWTEGELPAGYTLTGTAKEGTITTLTNTHTPEEVDATVKKVWDDEDDRDGYRPETLTVKLSNGDTVTLNAENNWEATVENLPKYEKGKEIEYTWTEDETGLPEGYSLSGTTKEGIITTITNKYAPGKTSVTVRKVWDDADNQDGKRPANLTVKLLADGEDTEQSVTLNEGNNWQATISDLYQKKDGKEIKYTWAEDETGLPEGYKLTNTATEGSITTLTNTYTPEEVTKKVVKKWNDNNSATRPKSVTVQLYADGAAVGEPVVLDASNNWSHEWTKLAKYANGKEITYLVKEKNVPNGYFVNVVVKGDTFEMTNSTTPNTGIHNGSAFLTGTAGASLSGIAILEYLRRRQKNSKK